MPTIRFHMTYGDLNGGSGVLRKKAFVREACARKWAAEALLEGTCNYISVQDKRAQRTRLSRTALPRKTNRAPILIHPVQAGGTAS